MPSAPNRYPPDNSTGTLNFLPLGNLAVSHKWGDFSCVACGFWVCPMSPCVNEILLRPAILTMSENDKDDNDNVHLEQLVDIMQSTFARLGTPTVCMSLCVNCVAKIE